jgi:hypothetical protein
MSIMPLAFARSDWSERDQPLLVRLRNAVVIFLLVGSPAFIACIAMGLGVGSSQITPTDFANSIAVGAGIVFAGGLFSVWLGIKRRGHLLTRRVSYLFWQFRPTRALVRAAWNIRRHPSSARAFRVAGLNMIGGFITAAMIAGADQLVKLIGP